MITYDTQEKREKRLEYLRGKRLDYLCERYIETKDDKWKWIALRGGFDIDYIPGYDDGEVPFSLVNEQ